MVSRVAGSLFWIGRHVERSDGTARILEVHLQLLAEDPWTPEDLACRALLGLMGAEVPADRELTRKDVLALLGVDRSRPASIACSLAAARDNARHARETVSTELWECLSTTSARMPRNVVSEKAHDFFAWVRERSALAVGIVEAGTSRDEAWRFFTLGRSLEQADMSARLLMTRSLTEASAPSWTTILRSCGAHESYLRTHPGVPTGQNAAEYLLLDPLFPRSVVFSLTHAEQCLRDLGPRADRARHALAPIRSRLEHGPIEEILADLPAHLESVQDAVSTASDGIEERYFPAGTAPHPPA